MLIHGACGGGGGSGGGSSSSGSTTAPQANFTATPTAGVKPLEVQFTNTSSANATDWLWEFGDGSTSNVRDPLRTYPHAGSFTVKLTATGPGGFTTKVRNSFIGVTAPLLDSSFESQAAGATPGLPWDVFFGTQGNVGLVMNSAAGGPDVNMPTDGQLWVEIGGDSTDTTLPPSAGPGPTPRTGAGLAQEITFPGGMSMLQFDVLFINGESFGAALSNDWMSADISDGNTSINLLTRNTFSATSNTSTLHGGHFTTALETVSADLELLFPGSNFLTAFTLTVQTGNGGNATLPSQVYLDRLRFEVPQPALDVQFVASPTQILAGGQVAFTDQTIGGSSWVWDFGDGVGSNAQSPAHVYSQAGLYTVSLHVSAPGTQGELVKTGLIVVLAPTGTVEFVGQPTTIAVNSPVQFTNLSFGNFSNVWLWDFGDGQTSAASGFGTPVPHGYSTPGLKSVRLTGTLTNGLLLPLTKTDYIDVQTPVSISSHPANVSVNLGQTANFTVVANGTPPLTYVWKRNGATIPGAPNAPNFTTAPTTAQDNGAKFRVNVSNALNSVLSNEATLTVVIPPVISVQPQPTTVPVGAQAVFTVTLQAGTGTAPLSFTWRKNGAAIPGAPNLPSFTTAPVSQTNNGELYSVRIANSAGSVVSNDALLTVSAAQTPPSIPPGGDPVSQTVCVGSPASFSVTANGSPTLVFQWLKNGSTPVGTNSSQFLIPTATTQDAAQYSCRVSNNQGSVTSQNATLTVNSAPTISAGPSSQTVCSGSQAQFSVTANGAGLTFQWLKNGSTPVGTNSSTLVIPSAGPSNAGQYSCRVSNTCGNITSGAATLTVNVSPSITLQPASTLFVVEGASKEFSVAATGANLNFAWTINGSPVGGNSSVVLIGPAVFATMDGAQIRCTVSNSCGSVLSSAGTLQVAKKWSDIYTNTITPKCFNCHDGGPAHTGPGSGNLRLDGGFAAVHVRTVGIASQASTSNSCAGPFRISGGNQADPLHNQGNPFQSILYNIQVGAFGACMSQDHTALGLPLTPAEILEIEECIRAGIPKT